MDAILLESVEGLGDSPFVASSNEIWESLQAERVSVSQELLSEGQLCECEGGRVLESEASEEYAREIKWQHRSHLEARLRDITDAQDRLIEGCYGRCTECGENIASNRLTADPAAALCAGCQRSVEAERALAELFERDSIH